MAYLKIYHDKYSDCKYCRMYLSYMNNFVKVPKPSYNISSIKLEVMYKA